MCKSAVFPPETPLPAYLPAGSSVLSPSDPNLCDFPLEERKLIWPFFHVYDVQYKEDERRKKKKV